MISVRQENKFIMGVVVLTSLLFLGVATTTHAAVACDFTRDLEIGIDGEDVRCLQQYLNDAGFTVAVSGVGAPGEETSLFRTLTEEAVIRWQQAHGLTPAVGYFGPSSRAKYDELITAGTTGATPSPTVLGASISTPTTPATAVLAEIEAKTLQLFLNVVDKLEEATDELHDVDDEDVRDQLRKANETFYRAIRSFVSKDYEKTAEYINDAINDAEDAIDEGSASEEKKEAEDAIDDAKDAIKDAEDLIEEADDDGKDIEEAEELLEEAEDALDDAEDAFDDEDWEDAIDAAEDAEELAKDAEDEL